MAYRYKTKSRFVTGVVLLAISVIFALMASSINGGFAGWSGFFAIIFFIFGWVHLGLYWWSADWGR